MQENITSAIMSCLLVSLPEESIWVLAVLITLRRFDLLDKYRWKSNVKWLSIPILGSIFYINICRYIIDAPRIFISLGALLIIYIGIIYILKSPQNNILNEKIPYIKIFLFVLLHFAILIILTESLYLPLLLKYFKASISQINNSWYISFWMSIPARVIQFLIIILLLSIQNRKVYGNILYSITSDKKISLIIISFILVLSVFWTLLINIFGDYNILSQIGISEQILFSVSFLIVPIILLVLMISLIIFFIEKINKIQKSHQNMFDDILDDDININ